MQGSSIPINVTIKGLHKNEKVYLRYDLSDGQVRGEMLPMKEEIQGINYKLDFGKDSGGLHQPLTYWIHAGDAVAGPFDVEIQIVPLVAIDHVDLVFPDYTNLKPRTIQQQGHFEAPEGTIAHIHAISNQAMQTARVEFDPVLQNKLFISAREFLDMKIDNNHLEATWTASIDRKNSIEKKITNYRVHAVNSLKEANHDPVIYQIKIIPDLPPEIEFTGNSNSAVDVPVDQGILLEMTARDPDYGLTAIEVQGSTENRLSPQKPKQLFKETLFEAEEENPRTKNAQYTFLPQQHQLKVGDEIDIVALASDNYHNPISHNLQPQRASSQPIRIRIVEPEIKPDNAQGPNEENPKNEPNIAQSQSPDPKSRIDWDRFRKDTQQNTGKSNSNANEKDTSQNSKGQPDDPQAQRSGQGGTDSGNGKTGSDKSSPNSDSTPSKSSPSGESNPASPNLDGNPRPSNDPNINPSENQSQDPNGSRKQDQTAFEKIQKFMKERQQSGSTDNQPESNQESSDQTGRNQRSNEKNGNQRSRGDQAGTENSGADMQNSDEPGSDEPDSDKAGSDKAGSDKTGSDKAGSDKAGSDKAGSDKAGSDKAGSDKAGSDKAGSDKAGSDKAGSDKAGSDKAGSDKAGSDKAGSDKAGSDKAGSDKAGSDKAGSDKAGSDKAGSDKAGSDKAGSDKAGSDKAGSDKAGSDKAGSDKAGSDKAGSDKAGSDKAGSDKAGSDKAGSDKAGSDKPGSDKPGSDKAGSDKAGSDKAGSDKAGSDKAGSDKAGSDKAGSDKAGSDKAGSDKAGSDKAGSDKAGSDKAGSDKAGSDKAGSDKAGSDKAGSDKAGSDKAGSDKAGSDKAGSDKAGSDKAGSDKAGSDKAGAADQQQGSGKSNQENPKSNGNPQKSPEQMGPEPAPNQEQGDGKGSGDEQGGKQGQPQSSEPSSAGSGKNTSGKTPKAGGASSTRPSQSAQFGADQANEEYSKKAADMLLEYIDRQRDQPDPELLNRLNWSQEDFRKFADRWREAKEQAKLNPAKRAELEETLSNLGLAGTGQKINRLKDRNDGLRGMQEEGGRLRPPEALREQFEAFRKAAGKLGK